MLTTVRKDGSFAILYGASAKDGDLALITDLKLAYVDKASGVTTLFNERAGSYFTGGDDGFPDANPWVLAGSSDGPILAHAFSRYGRPGGTFGGEATRFSADANQPAATAKINNTGFATGDFAVDPAAKFLYACSNVIAGSAIGTRVTSPVFLASVIISATSTSSRQPSGSCRNRSISLASFPASATCPPMVSASTVTCLMSNSRAGVSTA